MPQATRPLASVPPPLQEGLDSGWVLTASFMQPRLPYLCSVFAGPLHSFQTGPGLHSSGYIDPPQGAGEVEKLLPDVSLSVVYQRTWLWGGIVHCLGILLFGCLGFGWGWVKITLDSFGFCFIFTDAPRCSNMPSNHVFLNFLFFFGLSSLGKEENGIISVLTGSPGIGCLRVSVGCYSFLRGLPGGAVVMNPSTCRCRRYRWLGRSPRVRNGSRLWYSCLGNSTTRGAWRAIDHGVAKSWTRLSMHA